MKKLSLLLLVSALFFSCRHTPEPAPYGPIPTAAQLKWHELEYYAFVHFNMNTFTDEEWGSGGEKPADFNPSELDCKQWVKIFKDAGMKAVIITAKHHDGFCLWPSKTTEHSVKNSPYKNGNGDVIKELSEACRDAGLKFGVYLSPWDRNSAYYGKPEYIKIFRAQLTELLSDYGDIFEVWFDGANGGTGYYGGANEKRTIDRRHYYDWENTYKIIRKLQPNACIFGDGGPDVRWVGNEEGWAGKTNRSIIKHEACYAGMPNYKELSYGHEDGTKWVPAECDVSIRPGWYYHTREDHRVKSLAHMVDIYYQSIGRNASLLLNFPVDRRGLVHEQDARRVMELGEVIKRDFENNAVGEAVLSASDIRGNTDRFGPQNVSDNNKESYWATDDNVTEASLTLQFQHAVTFNRFLAQEYIPLGQRVEGFKLEAFIDDEWHVLDEQTTIGAKRILRLPTTTSKQIRFSVTAAKACPCISEIGVFNAPKLLIQPVIKRNEQGIVTIESAEAEDEVYFTTDGTRPSINSRKYREPFASTEKVTVKALVIDPLSMDESSVNTQKFDVAPLKWTIHHMEQADALKLIDGDINTAVNIKDGYLKIDLGEVLPITGFTYLPDQSRWGGNYIFGYAFYISKDGKNRGTLVSEDEFSNIENSPIKREKTFTEKRGRFITLVPTSIVRGRDAFSVAEFTVKTN